MNKITYLFGAGASIGALPVVNQMPERIQDLVKFLQNHELSPKPESQEMFGNLGIQEEKTKRQYWIEMINDLMWMAEQSSNHASVDTFAKKLFIRRNTKDLRKLKVALSIFFVLEQTRKGPDIRYDAFFASILSDFSNLPENIRIVSWNYDYQFELAYSEFIGNSDIDSCQSYLRVKMKYGDNSAHNSFGIFKLNGTTGYYSNGGWRRFFYVKSLDVIDKNYIELLIRNYALTIYQHAVTPSLSFAWEREKEDNSIVSLATNNISDSIALVIIGYSIPFFNREVDRKIFSSMNNLKRVYIQSPEAENVKIRLGAVMDNLDKVEVICYSDIEQFLLPNEL